MTGMLMDRAKEERDAQVKAVVEMLAHEVTKVAT